ncbi:MAG: hypothetical protein J1E97_08200, partial [Muribaculaceae bacterium]|nr:hypothetical protein [Muribaculaceae bacterium]
MRKLLLMLVACMVAFAANAANPDLYLRGDMTGGSWPALDKYKFTENNGVYTLNLDELYGAFKISTNNWNNSYNYGTSTKLKLDTEYTLTNGGSSPNMNLDGGITLKNVTMTFTLSGAKLKITGQAQENEYTDVYLVGDIGNTGWTLDTQLYPLKLKQGTSNTYEGSYTFSYSMNYFKMKAGTLVYGTGVDADKNVQMGENYTASQSGNSFVLANGTYDFTFVLEKNADTGVLTVTGQGAELPEVSYNSWYVNLAGAFNGNNFDATYTQPTALGIATFESIQIGKDAFELKTWDPSQQKDSYYNSCASGDLVPGQWTEISNAGYEGQFIKIAGAKTQENFKVEFDCTNNQIRVTSLGGGIDDPEPEIPTDLYLIGTLNEAGTWNPEGESFNNDGDNMFSIENVAIYPSQGDTLGYFGFTGASSADWSVVNGARYGASTKDEPIDASEGEVETTFEKGEYAWSIAPGIYNLYVGFDEMSLTVE